MVDVGMSWRSRAKQEEVREGSAARSGCSRQAWLCHPGTRSAVSTAPSLGSRVGLGSLHGSVLLPCGQLDFLRGWCSRTRAAVPAEPPTAVPLSAAISGCGGFLFWLCRGWYTPEQVSCTPDPTGLRFTIPADTSSLCQ